MLMSWRAAAGLAAVGVLLFTIAGPLERFGAGDTMTAHVAQHLLLGDVVAPLLLLALPQAARRSLGDGLKRLRGNRCAAAIVSPLGALFVWAVGATVWYLPPVHRWASEPGVPHLLYHVSFLVLGLLVWLAVFDVRPTQDLRAGLAGGGLPWWARHLYAVGSRTLMLPAALVVWFAAGYAEAPAFTDQVDAATLLIGFEMFLFVFALIATFIALAVHEGERINDTRS